MVVFQLHIQPCPSCHSEAPCLEIKILRPQGTNQITKPENLLLDILLLTGRCRIVKAQIIAMSLLFRQVSKLPGPNQWLLLLRRGLLFTPIANDYVEGYSMKAVTFHDG